MKIVKYKTNSLIYSPNKNEKDLNNNDKLKNENPLQTNNNSSKTFNKVIKLNYRTTL